MDTRHNSEKTLFTCLGAVLICVVVKWVLESGPIAIALGIAAVHWWHKQEQQ